MLRVSVFAVTAALSPGAQAASAVGEVQVAAFTEKYCAGCHNDTDKEAGLDLTSEKFALKDSANFLTWLKVHDRLQAGEMPPKEKKNRPDAAELSTFLGGLSAALTAVEQDAMAREGRSLQRRLNRYEYENALRDLFAAPWLQIKEQLPEDGEAFRFNKSGQALDVSHVHMSRYMAAADYAMRQMLSVQFVRPPTTTKRYYAREETSLTRFTPSVFNGGPDRLSFPVLGFKAQPDVRARTAPITVGEADPETRALEAVGWIHGNYVTGFSSPWTNFRAPVAGRYRVRFSGYTIWVGPGGRRYRFANGQDRVGTPAEPEWFRPNGDDVSPGRRYEPITVYAKGGTQNRRLGAFDITPEPGVQEVGDVWLLANEYFVTDACRFYRSRPGGPVAFRNPLAQEDGQPGVAFRWMEVEGPLYDEATTAGYQLLFGDLPLRKIEGQEKGVTIQVIAPGTGGRGRGGRGRTEGSEPGAAQPGPPGQGRGPGGPVALPLNEAAVEVVSTNPELDAERLLRGFMARAYRRPVQEAEVQRYLGLVRDRMKKGLGFTASMLAGYTAVLSSPAFVFLQEKPGPLDDYALATRLALFLWNSVPDERLWARAERGELRRPEVLREEADRLLADRKSSRFVEAFLDYWLDIRKMDDTTPSTTLYNDYYLDDALGEAALDETRLFFSEMLQRDLPARTIVDSDFTYLNDRLARHYGIPGVTGIAMRRFVLPSESPRGGLLTQASILKVTANGTTTSPVLRGKWITDRILGLEIPPPPASVVAVEPDIRGAVTIRQQLEKHRSDKSCATCHTKMDPPGFALESFDIMGGWRDRYRASAEDKPAEKGWGMNGWPYAFHYALPVDSAGELPDGRTFRDVREFKRQLLQDPAPIARNVVKQLVIYATGAPVRFSERAQVEKMLRDTRSREYGIRSLVHAVVQSELFLNK